MSARVAVPAAEADVLIDADVVVCGAGAAGLGAALGAARAGADVALVERWPFFGGNATAASLGSICGLYVQRDDGFDHLNGGVAREWAAALSDAGWAMGPIPYKQTAVMTYVPWGYKRVADRLVGAESRIRPLLHAFISGVVRSGSAIEAVVIATKRGPHAVRGRVFVDATGDADIAYHAGCPWEMGEAGRVQYPSMQFHMQGIDLQAALAGGLASMGSKLEEAYRGGSYDLTRSGGAVIPTMRPGEGIGAMTRIAGPDGGPVDATDVEQLTAAELRGRAVAEEAARFLADEIPGFASAYLQDTAVTLGVRETRHVIGEHVLTEQEAGACTTFEDGVAGSAWPFEFHTQGADTRWEFLDSGAWFEVPYRSLVATDVDNLLVAGRCISATHEALASLRVTGVCMAVGEAAGRAAARCVADDLAPRDLDGARLRAELVDAGLPPRR